MRFLRHGPPGHERPAMLDREGRLRDISGIVTDISASSLSACWDKLFHLDPERLPLVPQPGRIGACVAGVGKFVGIGLNYFDHAAEFGSPLPGEPIVFLKATSSICGPYDDIEIPIGSSQLDYEAELGVVIGQAAKYVPIERAMDHVLGYCTVNDASERHFQKERQGQWTKGKSHDTFGAIGPWLVTADEVSDPQKLGITAYVDGVQRQRGNTEGMVFPIARLISYVSRFMTLHPGDILATGTPAGVGMGFRPDPRYLRDGEVLEVEVEGLGRQRHRCVALQEEL